MEDGSSSDTSNDDGVVGSLSDEYVTSSAAGVGVASIQPPVSPADGSSVTDVSGTLVQDSCRVQQSPLLGDSINGSPATSLSRGDDTSAIRPSVTDGHCQHISKLSRCCCYADLRNEL